MEDGGSWVASNLGDVEWMICAVHDDLRRHHRNSSKTEAVQA